MYRILIVDDHADQRDFLQFLFTSHSADWQVTEAVNGKEAVALCESTAFDFIITDVKMPFLSGIELAEKIREQNIQSPILFISGYDDFKYVKKALTLQAIDYLLKPINPEEFHQQLDKMIEQFHLSESKQQHLLEIQQLQKQKIVTNLLHGVSLKQLPEKEQRIAFDFLRPFHFLFLIEAESQQILSLETFFQNDAYYSHRVSSSRIVLFHKANSLSDGIHETHLLEQHLQLKLGKNYILERSDFITEPGDFFNHYQLLEKQIAHHFYLQEPNLKIAATLPTKNTLEELAVLQQIKTFLKQHNLTQLESFIQDLLNQYKQAASESPMITKFFFTNVYKTMIETSDLVLSNKQGQFQKLLEATRFSEIEPLFNSLFKQLVARQDIVNEGGNEYVRGAKNYILNHYQKELNLETIAHVINISPKYLSELFIREEGIGISKYLKEVRMEQAKELLQNSSYRVREISEAVGFSNHSYFIRNFRESVGMTPETYRKSHNQVIK